MRSYKVAIAGATGLVGVELLRVIRENKFPVNKLFLFASQKRKLELDGREFDVYPIEEADPKEIDIAFFATDSELSRRFIPRFLEEGVFIIDKSRAFRYEPDIPLVVPEINGNIITRSTRLVANPNCTTIQLAMTLEPIRKIAKLKKVVATTLQSVSGAGAKALDYLLERTEENQLAFEIKGNIIPLIGSIDNENYCDEENTIQKEINKIFGETIDLAVSTLRVSIPYAHSISCWVKLGDEVSIGDIVNAFCAFPGLEYVENPPPMPLYSKGKNAVFVGRLKRDKYDPYAFSFFSVTDNLRKGAATNAIQIAFLAMEKGII